MQQCLVKDQELQVRKASFAAIFNTRKANAAIAIQGK